MSGRAGPNLSPSPKAAACQVIEAEKLKAIGLGNRVDSEREVRKRKQLELQAMINEKKAELERPLTLTLTLTLILTLILTLTLTPNPNPKPKPHQISPHEMGDDALLSRTAALGLIASAHFGRDASHEVRAGCSPTCSRLQPCMCPGEQPCTRTM